MRNHSAHFDFLAIDIGATSGRVMHGYIAEEKLFVTEKNRFSTGAVDVGGELYWDVLAMMKGIYGGLQAYCATTGDDVCIGIDTFGMDFALLDKKGRLLANPYSYRGDRGARAKAIFDERHRGELFNLTGIADREYNTSYMLYSLSLEQAWNAESIDKLLFIPDLLAYYLTGNAFCDASIISPGQIIQPGAQQWNQNICQMLGVNLERFAEIRPPAAHRGTLLKRIAEKCGLPETTEVLFGIHDTAAALEAIPTEDKSFAFISSGTWSLMGLTSEQAIINNFTRQNSFSNVCDLNGNFMVLKNIMGMWVIEACKKEWEAQTGCEIGWDGLLAEAQKCGINSYIDISDELFFPDGKMVYRIQRYCADTGQNVPLSQGEVVKVVLESLAMNYKETFMQLEFIAGKPFEKLYIVGGGSKNVLLNQYTANAVNAQVISGPAEATVIGNVLLQAAKKNAISLTDKAKLVQSSFPISCFLPKEKTIWGEKWKTYRAVIDKKRGGNN